MSLTCRQCYSIEKEVLVGTWQKDSGEDRELGILKRKVRGRKRQKKLVRGGKKKKKKKIAVASCENE